MRFVSPKAEAWQALSVLHLLRESPVRGGTKTANQMYGFLLAFGMSLPRGLAIMRRLPVILTQHELPHSSQDTLGSFTRTLQLLRGTLKRTSKSGEIPA